MDPAGQKGSRGPRGGLPGTGTQQSPRCGEAASGSGVLSVRPPLCSHHCSGVDPGHPQAPAVPTRTQAAGKRKTAPTVGVQSRLLGRNAGATCRSPCPAVTTLGGERKWRRGQGAARLGGRGEGGQDGWQPGTWPEEPSGGKTQDGRERRRHATRPLRRGGTRDGSLMAPPHGATRTGDCY